jgi:hypothetical protein
MMFWIGYAAGVLSMVLAGAAFWLWASNKIADEVLHKD